MYRLVLLILFVILLIGCDGTAPEVENTVIPDKNVSFTEHIQRPLMLKCATAGCHDDVTMAGGYSLITYTDVTHPRLVDKFSPETSLLVLVINGIAPVQMPPMAPRTIPLTKNQVDGIITWIKEGAKDN